ncbi:MAG: hypothetical protein JWM07_711 [Candidatus Saccharibacteria bacterium]|nr:hypothetical protein [Candidatus Saccharibacteria bacterium]
MAFSVLFSFIILNPRTDLGMLFPILGAGILMFATGLAALVAIAITFFRPTHLRYRRVALACFVVLTVYPAACMIIWP